MTKEIELDLPHHEKLREEQQEQNAIRELIERLAELCELKYQTHTLHAPIAMAHAQVAIIALQAELESFREDAERYRLIRAQICVSCPTHTKLDT